MCEWTPPCETRPSRCTRLPALERRAQDRVLEERAVVDRLVDPHQVLVEPPARADRQVADLAVPHLTGRQAGRLARGLERRVRVLAPQPVEDRCARRVSTALPGPGGAQPQPSRMTSVTSGNRTGRMLARAAAAAAGWASQPSAGITVDVIDVRVREFVDTNWATSISNAFSGERRSSEVIRACPASGSDTHACTSRIDSPPSAAACSSAARTRRAWASQNSRSPDPPRPVAGGDGAEHVRGPLRRGHRVGAAGQRVERDRRRQPGQAGRR